jgi:hypothetical protein
MNALEDASRSAIKRVLAFANLQKITIPELAYDALEGTDSYSRSRNAGLLQVPPSYMRKTRISDREAIHFLTPHLARVDRLLTDLASNARKARATHDELITQLAGEVLMVKPTFHKGELEFTLLSNMLGGIEGTYGLALALLYDARRPYGAALARCRLESCEKWLLSLARYPGGRRPVYCDSDHQRAADKVRAVERARAWRRGQKEEMEARPSKRSARRK